MNTKRTGSKANRILVLILFIFVLLVLVFGAKLTFFHKVTVANTVDIFKKQCLQIGIASWYGKDMTGRLTASGEKYDPKALTAAHMKLPFGTRLRVINLGNWHNITVTVNDRGPYLDNRIIDLSAEAARQLGMKKPGLVAVCVQYAAKTDTKTGLKAQ